MATKQFMTLGNLQSYDTLIKEYIGTEDAKSIKSITVVGNTVSFFKTADASGTASYTVNLPDVSGFMDKIASATGGKIVTSTANGQVAESETAISDLATNAFVGSIPSGATATTVTGYAKEVADSKDSAITAAQDAADTAQGEVDALETLVGSIPAGSEATTVIGYVDEQVDAVADDLDALDQSLAAIAKSGDSADASYDNTTSGLVATDVQAAIDEVVGGLGTAAAADIATSAIQEESTDAGLVSAEQVATFVAAEIAGLEGAMHFRGVITRQTGETDAQAIARVITDPESGDVVVMSDNAKEYIYDGTSWEEVGDEAEFVKKTTTIAGVDLQDNITKTELLTALNVADGAQVNVLETVQVNGSALTPDANKAVNVTVAEGTTNGTVAVNGSDVAVHGLGSAAYTASTAYEAAGSITTAIEALDADLDASGTAQHSGTFVVSGVTEVDGVLTAVDSVEVESAGAAATAKSEVIGTSADGASASTIYGCKAYADASTEGISTSDIEALFS